jgi:hypothetical protein
MTVLTTATMLGWALWIILFGAMLSAIAWTLGVWYFTSQWDELRGFNGLAAFIEEDWPTGIAFCGVFLAWAALRTWVIPPFSTAVRSRVVTQPWPDAASG